MISKFIAVLSLTIWLSSSVYLGTGGFNFIQLRYEENIAKNSSDTVAVIFHNISFKNIKVLNLYHERNDLLKIFPIVTSLTTSLLELITIFSFGIIGSVTYLIKQIVINDSKVQELKYISQPLLGMLTGLVIIGISYLIPSSLTTNEIEIKPTSLMFLSLFSGFFSISFYEYMAKFYSKLLK